MISNVASLIKSTVSAFLSSGHSASNTITNPNASSAHRVGPQRVIFTARINGVGEHIKLGDISLSIPFRGFAKNRRGEESVLVIVEPQAINAVSAPMSEKRATLKVKPDTNVLSVTFVDGADRVRKSERIAIK